VATAPQDGYTPYWLGRGFVAGGLTFTGPYTADFAEEVEGGGSWGVYIAKVGKQGAVTLSVRSYSAAAWARLPLHVPPNASTVTVGFYTGTI
jgi:hypothetical protein